MIENKYGIMKRYLPIYLLLAALNVQSKEISSNSKQYGDCGLNNKSKQLAQLVIEADSQQRITLTCNKQLAQAAYQKAKEMAEAQKVSHYINYISPNELLAKAGIELPFSYNKVGNQVEAVSGGMRTSQESFDYFMTSENHKMHLLGENDFYKKQDKIGVGHYVDKSKKHVDYWVVYITSLREQGDTFNSVLRFKPTVFKPKVQKRKKRMLGNYRIR